MDSYNFDYIEARREVESLLRLAEDFSNDSFFATVERLYSQAYVLAERLDDQSLLVKTRRRLASSLRMQGKFAQAIVHYSWIIGVGLNPISYSIMLIEDIQYHTAVAFMDFVECGRSLPEMSTSQLHRVVDEGLNYIDNSGRSEWAAGIRIQRGLLFKREGDYLSACREMEAALALNRRYPNTPGYSQSMYRVALADILRLDITRIHEAKLLVDEVLTSPSVNIFGRQWAYKTLAYIYLAHGELDAALNAANWSLTLALSIESHAALVHAYRVRLKIYIAGGNIAEARDAVVREWRYARRDGRTGFRMNSLANCVCVRLMQTRKACTLSLTEKTLPIQVPTQANYVLANRYLHSAHRLLDRAQPLAMLLDRATGRRTHQDELNELRQKAEQIEEWLVH